MPIASCAAALSGWKYADPWSPSITVIVPPGFSSAFSAVSASTGRARCSSTKQTKTWSNDAGANGRSKMSARRNVDVREARRRRSRRSACASESAETSTDVKRALRAALRERDGLGADAAARLEHRAPRRVGGVGVQQVDERPRLVLQALDLARLVAVDVCSRHVGTVQSPPVKPVPNIDDPRFVKALGHPMRVRILALLQERTATPRELAQWLDSTLGTVSYHVRALFDLGLLELVRTTQVRGAIAHHYRARERPRISDEAWAAAPPIAKQAAVGATLLTINDYAQASAEAGGFERDEAQLSRAAPAARRRRAGSRPRRRARSCSPSSDGSRRRPPSGWRRTRTRPAPPTPPS